MIYVWKGEVAGLCACNSLVSRFASFTLFCAELRLCAHVSSRRERWLSYMKMLLRFNCIVFFASSSMLCAVLRCYKREVAFAYAPAIHFLRRVERRWLISNCWAIMTGWLPNNHSCTLPNGRWWTPHAAPASLTNTIELSVLRGTLHFPVYLYLYLYLYLHTY